MKELEIQKFLRSRNLEEAISQLEHGFGVYHKQHQVYPHIYQFTYDMLEGKFAERITQECRGIILDSNKNWDVLAYPYDKFWEEDNVLADKLDWNTTRVLEKVDGTLITLWFNPYSTNWEVATRGTPDASGCVGMSSKTFSDLFWETWDKLGYKLPYFKSICFMFELCTLENKVVCVYKEPRIVLHGARNTVINTEFNYSNLKILAESFNWELIKSYDLTSITDVLKACESLDPISHEGYVCVDANFNRIKAKSIQYKALSHIKDGMGKKRLVEMVRQDSADTFTKYFPEYLDMYMEIAEKYLQLNIELRYVYSLYEHIQDQKEFAIAITNVLKGKNNPFCGALFSLRAGKTSSIKDYLKNININSLVDYLT